jgi:hypothetical protein
MDLKEKLITGEALHIAKAFNIMNANLIENYKSFLQSNHLTYKGKVVELSITANDLNMSFTKEFEDWCFKNATIFKQDITLVAILEAHDDDGTRGNKRKITRDRKGNGGNRGPKKQDKGETGQTGV